MKKLEVNLMATKKRFKEAEFVDQNETQAQAVPATDAEVAQAAPVEAAPAEPVDAAPVEDEAVLPEGTDEATDDSGVEVNPATVSVQVQIPVDQLGAAVAQATGDQEVANLSPDVESAQEAELVSETPDEDIPVEGATEEAPAETGGDEGVEPQLESKESTDNRLQEDVFTDSDKVEGKDDYGKGDSSDDSYQDGKDSANKHEDTRMDMIDHAIPEEGKALKESEDDAEVEDEVEDEVDDLPPGMKGEDVDLDIDALGGEEGPGFAASNEFDVEIDENDPAVQDFLSKIDDYLADEEAQPAQVADALRASADFFDAIAPEEEEVEDGDLLDVEEGEDDIEDEGDIPLDLDAINGYKTSGHAKTGDDVLDQFSELPEEDEDYEESVTRVPCKFPGKKFSESRRAPRDLPLVRENKKIKEAVEDDFEEDEDWDVSAKFDRIVEEWGAEKTLSALFDYGLSNCPDLINDFIAEVENGDVSLFESKKPVAKKLKEEADYSAVKFPAGSSDADDDNDIVSVYEKTQNSRRNAIRNFRESVIRNEENIPSRQSASRFNEALRSSVRMNGSSKGSKSWADNRFLDKYNESQELNFKQLISEGFLG